MKRLLALVSVVLCVLGLVAWTLVFSRSWVVIHQDQPLHTGYTDPPRMIDEQTSKAICNWLDRNRSGWNPSLVTFAPRKFISGDGFLLQVYDDFVVLNYVGILGHDRLIQKTKKLNKVSKAFWKEISVKWKDRDEKADL